MDRTHEVLKSHREALLADLLKSYPDDYRLKMLGDLMNLEPEPSSLPVLAPRLNDGHSINFSKSHKNSSIVNAAIKVFRESVPYPAFCVHIIPLLRDAGAILPRNDSIAASTVSAIFTRRPDIFKKHPGPSRKATSLWHLQSLDDRLEPVLLLGDAAKSDDVPGKYNMSEENRQKAADRMKELWASGKLKRVNA